jgi:hypothetical protein
LSPVENARRRWQTPLAWKKIKRREKLVVALQKKARLELENKTGRKVISAENYLAPPKYKTLKNKADGK